MSLTSSPRGQSLAAVSRPAASRGGEQQVSEQPARFDRTDAVGFTVTDISRQNDADTNPVATHFAVLRWSVSRGEDRYGDTTSSSPRKPARLHEQVVYISHSGRWLQHYYTSPHDFFILRSLWRAVAEGKIEFGLY